MGSIKRRCRLIGIVVMLNASVAAASEVGPANLSCSNPLPKIRRGTFRLEGGRVQLRDGPSYLTGGKQCDPTSQDVPCEFAVELTRAEEWGTQPRFLVAVVNTDHRQGSGAWDSVFVYVCRGRSYVPVFAERYFYGAKVVLGSASDLWVTSGVWGPKDPNCCASSERREHYVWSARTRRFVVAESTVRPLRE